MALGTDIPEEARKRITGEILAFLEEECEVELSRFRGEMLLDFVAGKIAAEVYNNALLDCRAYLAERLEDMEASLFRHSSPGGV
jgi:uncharacterized protein (DUF2164 family)